MRHIRAAAFLWVAASSLLADEYVFRVNGEPRNLRIVSLEGTPEAPRPGDLVDVGDFFVALTEQTEYDFLLDDDQQRLLLRAADGTERVIGVSLFTRYDHQGQKQLVDGLAMLTPEERRGLACVRLEGWSADTDKHLGELDTGRVALFVADEAAQGREKALPALPEGLQHLVIENHSSDGLASYAALGTLTHLRVLWVDALGAFDAAPLAACPELRDVSISARSALHLESLSTCAEMRRLDLSSVRDLKDVSFLSAMPRLRLLDVGFTAVSDLSPLSDHASIVGIRANGSAVETLPGGTLPALRTLDVMSTRLVSAEVQAFADRHAECAVRHQWMAALTESLEGCDRLRVMSGGTCHNLGEPIFEETDPETVREVIGLIQIEEPKRIDACMCCGTPTLEFYEGKTLKVKLGVHHGFALRWPEGWPGDASMSKVSGDALVKWLADRGVTGPQEDRDESNRQRGAVEDRMEAYAEVLGEETWGMIQASSGKEAIVVILKTRFPDPVERAKACLRLYGCDDASWNVMAVLDGLCVNVLSSFEQADLGKAVYALRNDAMGANGAARWLFGERKWESIDAETLAEVIPSVSEQAMAHPRAICRHQTISALAAIRGEKAIAVLRRVLASEIKPRALPEGAEDPPGSVVFRGQDREVPQDASELAHAAQALATLGDAESLPRIEELLKSATDADAEVFKAAAEKLSVPK